jgi:predicted nucleic acid-binding Zn ribbon protein
MLPGSRKIAGSFGIVRQNRYIAFLRRPRLVRSKKAIHISDLLKRVLGDRKFRQGVRQAEIKLRWEEIVGPEIAARTRPLHLSRGRLLVECDHDVWRTELSFLKPEILKRIAEVQGEGVVKEIFLK